jgi:hypothetical protein
MSSRLNPGSSAVTTNAVSRSSRSTRIVPVGVIPVDDSAVSCVAASSTFLCICSNSRSSSRKGFCLFVIAPNIITLSGGINYLINYGVRSAIR